jgi:hypothetical protein
MEETSLIQIEDSTLTIGQEKINLVSCTSEDLTDAFGETEEILDFDLDPRYKLATFSFQMHLIKAYIQFKLPLMYFNMNCLGSKSIIDNPAKFSPEDKGMLTELHVELWEPLPFLADFEEHKFFHLDHEKFIIFGPQFVARLSDENSVDYLVFINQQLIKMQNAFFISNRPPLETREARFFELQEQAREIKKAESGALGYRDIASLTASKIVQIIYKDEGPTKK